jgi:hypothetical protein
MFGENLMKLKPSNVRLPLVTCPELDWPDDLFTNAAAENDTVVRREARITCDDDGEISYFVRLSERNPGWSVSP